MEASNTSGLIEVNSTLTNTITFENYDTNIISGGCKIEIPPIYNFRIYCITEDAYIKAIGWEVPKSCPHNCDHIIDESRTYITDSDLYRTVKINNELVKGKSDSDIMLEEIALLKKKIRH